MENLIDIIIKEGYADEYLCNEFKTEKKAVRDLRKEFICSLNERIKFRNSVYEDMLKKEGLVLQEIESIVNHELIRRAYVDSSKSERIKSILEPLLEGKAVVLKDYKLLKEMKNALLNILDEQLTFEKKELQKIRDSIGEEMYNDYEMYFKSNNFLRLIHENDLNK